METEATRHNLEGLKEIRSEVLLRAMAKAQLDSGDPDLYALFLLRLTLVEQKLDSVLSTMKAGDEPTALNDIEIDNTARQASRTKGLIVIGVLLLAAVLLL